MQCHYFQIFSYKGKYWLFLLSQGFDLQCCKGHSFLPENKQCYGQIQSWWKLLLSQNSKIIDLVGKIDCDHHV